VITLTQKDNGNSTVFDKNVTIEKSITNISHTVSNDGQKVEVKKPEPIVEIKVEKAKPDAQDKQLTLDDFEL
jgi:hypothetical protein